MILRGHRSIVGGDAAAAADDVGAVAFVHVDGDGDDDRCKRPLLLFAVSSCVVHL